MAIDKILKADERFSEIRWFSDNEWSGGFVEVSRMK
jgi:hypothetical protein